MTLSLDQTMEDYEQGNYQEAFEGFQQLSEENDSFAKAMLGYMYLDGIGVPQDYKKAKKWLDLAHNHGEESASSLLGDMYRSGLGVPQDQC